MTVLSGYTIRALRIVSPCLPRTEHNGMTFGVGPAGYDVRLKQELDLLPGQFMLGSIIEHIMMPNNVLGYVHDKSTLARLGISMKNTVVEPGWRGYLTVEINNHGPERVRLQAGSPIAQIIFHYTDIECVPYDGKYQDQGDAPVEALFTKRG